MAAAERERDAGSLGLTWPLPFSPQSGLAERDTCIGPVSLGLEPNSSDPGRVRNLCLGGWEMQRRAKYSHWDIISVRGPGGAAARRSPDQCSVSPFSSSPSPPHRVNRGRNYPEVRTRRRRDWNGKYRQIRKTAVTRHFLHFKPTFITVKLIVKASKSSQFWSHISLLIF